MSVKSKVLCSRRQDVAQCLKITEKVSFNIASEASYVYNLCDQKFIEMPKIVNYLSGNTVLLQAPNFQTLAKMEHFWHF